MMSTVPAIWFLELHELNIRINHQYKSSNNTTTVANETLEALSANLGSILGVSSKEIHVSKELEHQFDFHKNNDQMRNKRVGGIKPNILLASKPTGHKLSLFNISIIFYTIHFFSQNSFEAILPLNLIKVL